MLPKQNTKILRAGREELTQALDRVSLFSDNLTRQVKFSITSGKLRLVVQTPDQGEANEEIEVKYTADDLDIGYNASYILDILRTIDSEEIVMQLNTPVTAGLVMPAAKDDAKAGASQEDLLCLVMPLRLAG